MTRCRLELKTCISLDHCHLEEKRNIDVHPILDRDVPGECPVSLRVTPLEPVLGQEMDWRIRTNLRRPTWRVIPSTFVEAMQLPPGGTTITTLLAVSRSRCGLVKNELRREVSEKARDLAALTFEGHEPTVTIVLYST